MAKRCVNLLCGVVLAGIGTACAGDAKWNEFWKLDTKDAAAEKSDGEDFEVNLGGMSADSYAFRDTVGAYCWVVGSRKMAVRGYGLVVGLGTKGTKRCPDSVRKALAQEIRKRRLNKTPYVLPREPISPEELIRSEDTAVVFVQGQIPGFATKGSKLDIFVRALPGTDVKSLEGGKLYAADLHRFVSTGDGAALEGKVVANGEGPVFMNPFGHKSDAVTKTNLRVGRIINGGTVLEDRSIRLNLLHRSYQYAVRIANRINDRFSINEKVADPISDSAIDLFVPAEYRDDPRRFVELVKHVFVPRPPGFLEERAAKLVKEIEDEKAPHDDIALCWEAMGKEVLGFIRPLYSARRPHVRFYAARTGLRMLEEPAAEVLIRQALSARNPFRIRAIHELGKVNRFRRNTEALEKLLDDKDPRVRIAACSALIGHRTDRIKSKKIGKGKFRFDIVQSDGPPLIYATVNQEPRIVLFGPDVQCSRELFYAHRDDAVILTAQAGEATLTLVRKTPYLEIVSDPIAVSRKVAALIEMLGETPGVEKDRVKGVGMNYSQVVEILASLCGDRSIPAKFTLQQPSVRDLFKPIRLAGRPETSEL